MNIRSINRDDLVAIRKSLAEAISSAEEKGWLHMVDLEIAMRVIEREFISLIISDTYLLCVQVTSPWFASEETKTISEMLVLRVYPAGPGKFQDIPRALCLLAEVEGAGDIVVGTALATSNRALARMYLREGFTQSGVELHRKL